MAEISFGTDGWRAIIAEDFTFANVEKVAYAIACYIKEQKQYKSSSEASAEIRRPILVGYDTRFLADKFALRAAQVFISMGIPALLCSRDVPTPVIAYATQIEPTCGAVQITASHNPPEYCGIKYIPEYAGPATNEITAKIVAHLSELPHKLDVHSIEVPRFNPKQTYLSAVSELIDFEKIRKAKLKVGLECLYSTSREYLDELLLASGVELEVLHNWRDPLFGGGMPEPKAEYLTELSKLVKEKELQIGLATDGDADRFAVIDDQGEYVSPNQLLSLLTKHLLKNCNKRGAIVKTVATTHLLDRLAEMYGLEIYETPVGFKYIGELMRQKDILIGGEESGGCSFKGHIPEKDGIMCNMLMVEMLACESKPLSQIWHELVKEVGVQFAYRRRDLRLTPEGQKDFVEKLDSAYVESTNLFKIKKLGRLDGFKYYMEDGSWVLVRPSGTEPLVRFYYEAPSIALVEDLKTKFDTMVDETLNGLGAKVLNLVH